jgi:1,4-alpha-glucan branching enzyme
MHDTLVYFHKRPDRRRLHRREITFRGFYLDNERWVLPLSHDEVVHGKRTLLGKMPGTGEQRFASLRSLLANQVGQPGKKLLFMGTELAPEREWDHDRELPWKEADGDVARIGVARLLDDLAALYHSSPSLWAGDADPGGFAWIDGAGTADPWVVAWVRRGARPGGPEEVTVVVQNGAATARPEYLLGLPVPGRWDELLNTDAASYGGTNVGNSGSVWAEERPWGDHPASARVILPPRGTLFLRPSPS